MGKPDYDNERTPQGQSKNTLAGMAKKASAGVRDLQETEKAAEERAELLTKLQQQLAQQIDDDDEPSSQAGSASSSNAPIPCSPPEGEDPQPIPSEPPEEEPYDLNLNDEEQNVAPAGAPLMQIEDIEPSGYGVQQQQEEQEQRQVPTQEENFPTNLNEDEDVEGVPLSDDEEEIPPISGPILSPPQSPTPIDLDLDLNLNEPPESSPPSPISTPSSSFPSSDNPSSSRRSSRKKSKNPISLTALQPDKHAIPRAAFMRMLRETLHNVKSGLRITKSAAECIQAASEALLVEVFEDGTQLQMHAKRKTLFVKDMRVGFRLRSGDWPSHCNGQGGAQGTLDAA